MEKISAFFIILVLVSSCMVTMSVGDICQTDRDCVEIGIPRCKNGKMPICYNGYCSCFARRRFTPPPPPPPPPHSSTLNSPSSSTSKF
ncbi:PREDICTED: defensin-like protein 311 [Camelina sativa]|uniref:Defensin-like protein 311 n=1 Tax=Camelina sativa TaxID=90675 RepID=A0ABM0XIU4_CAMSA|nr:PREDICTED: defensin-like protein 311 [Camelina sativa]